MTDIINFINTFLGAPLQLVIILLVFALFIYWYIKIRPNETKQIKEIYDSFLKEANSKVNNDEKERERFLKVIEEANIQAQRINVLYDKALENSNKVIENNTIAFNNFNTNLQLMNQALERLNKATNEDIERTKTLEDSTHILKEEVRELTTTIRMSGSNN